MNKALAGIKTLAIWIWKILKKGIWLLGFLPQSLDYVSTYIPSQYTPTYVRDLLEKGADWRLTSSFVGIGLLVSAFLVHLETQRELREREIEIRELEDQKPRITVGFQDETGRLAKTLRIQLCPLPPKPDLNTLVEEKRKHLLGKRRDRRSPYDILATTAESVLSTPNPHYEEDIEQYLPKYRRYLVRRYEHRIAKDRTRSVVPIVHNEGHHPANNVTVGFTMPEAYREPAEHQRRVSPIPEDMLEELEFSEEELLKLEERSLCEPPKEPQVSISSLGYLAPTSLYSMPPSPFPERTQEASNASGPVHEIRDGVHHIVYRVEQLIQHCPEGDFEPFYVWLGEITHSVTWEIPVRITSANLREPEQDVLRVEIEVVEDTKAG